MTTAEASIPYERQSDAPGKRMCGAACLSMVYRSFGKDVPQAKIWPAIASENRFGSLASSTHLMAQDALDRGFGVVAMQARNPLQVLRICRDRGIRAILNHRMQRGSPAGHYSVLADIDDRAVVLHDPFLGPSRQLSHGELLELWEPQVPNSEIAGKVLIGVLEQPLVGPACQLCRTAIPPKVNCPKCNQPVSLEAGALLGCMVSACMGRLWNHVCCPACDSMWTFGDEPPQANAQTPTAGQEGLNIERLLGELDKFSSYILSLPVAAGHPEIRQQLNFIAATKEKLTRTLAEQAGHRKVRREQLAALVAASKENQIAHGRRMQEVSKPSPPLDGNALGRALLKNLGFNQ